MKWKKKKKTHTQVIDSFWQMKKVFFNISYDLKEAVLWFDDWRKGTVEQGLPAAGACRKPTWVLQRTWQWLAEPARFDCQIRDFVIPTTV